jgi:acetyl/propionyl-CoA carboxylase alpha subunit
VRVDTHLQAGATVPPYYDSLLAKVIAHGGDRDGALAALRDALDRCAIDGVSTNLGLQRALLADPEFAAGGVDTGYLARWLARNQKPARDQKPARNQRPARDQRPPGDQDKHGTGPEQHG